MPSFFCVFHIHSLTDILTLARFSTHPSGEVHDINMVESLLEGMMAENVLADRGYDSKTMSTT